MLDTAIIFSDDQYKQYCKVVSNYSSQWEDLYQEFAVELLTKKHKVTSSVENYCRGVIYHTWRRLNGYGHGSKAESMLLGKYADRGMLIDDNVSNDNECKADSSDEMDELNKLLTSNGRARIKAEITSEFLNGTNRLKISKARGINYRTAHDAVRDTIETIKTNMTKNEIKESLLAQGINASYSGKDKTFYTDKTPSSELDAKIIKSGFKQCKK